MQENVEAKDSVVVAKELSEENVSGEEKREVNLEVLEDGSSQQPVYQIRPLLHEKFKPLRAKEVIQNVLYDHLSAKTYDKEEAETWTKDIADTIRDKVKELEFNHYKYAVNVVMGEQRGAGVKMGTRCIWDAEADTYTYNIFTNVRVPQAVLKYYQILHVT